MSVSNLHAHHANLALKDYLPSNFLVDELFLDFDLYEEKTVVLSKFHCYRNRQAKDQSAPLVLNGKELTLKSILLNGKELLANQYHLDKESLTIFDLPHDFWLEIKVIINPKGNKSLSGLYISNENYCTQCEANGFRRVTYFLDRPDVMSHYTVTIKADKRYSILLSNGDLIEKRELSNGRHCTVWKDSSKKPCYLFALVAGNFDELKDQFTTLSGKGVELYLYVEKGYRDQAEYALICLKNAMKWDEEKFGREYDLGRYTIVAVSDFNAGAMENKALNIFNTKYILAKPETATDDDYIAIEEVIGHEYFHNWTGNRITCRNWFQLTLKEGLTVLRDQLFTEDRTTPLIGRIKSASVIRNRQFAEDAGPTAHPIRPDHYMSVDNLYTSTVYNKGAEVIRMIRTLLGEAGFRRGMDLYFERHDGEAVTTEDFVKAMADANHYDLKQFKYWYDQKGTPILKAKGEYNEREHLYTLIVEQFPPVVCGKPLKDQQLFHIPLVMGLLDEQGEDIDLYLKDKKERAGNKKRLTLEIKSKKERFVFEKVRDRPIPSLLRHFSSPVKLYYDYSDKELATLMRNDSDHFNRWLASQHLLSNILLKLTEGKTALKNMPGVAVLLESFRYLLSEEHQDYHLASELLTLPTLSYLIEIVDTPVEIKPLIEAHQSLRSFLGNYFEQRWLACYKKFSSQGEYQYSIEELSRRAFKNRCLDYLLMKGEKLYYQKAFNQLKNSNNMTDSLAALNSLNHHPCHEREEGMSHFYRRWKDEPLVMNKWLAIQASSLLPNVLEKVKELMKLPVFELSNPNNVHALIGAFSLNPAGFHREDGEGYHFLAEQIVRIDHYNAQLAGRLVPPLLQWKKYDELTQKRMKNSLKTILETKKLSSNVYDLVSKAI